MRALSISLLKLLFLLPLLVAGMMLLALGLALSPWGTGLLLEEGAKQGFYQLERAEGAPLDRLVLHGFQLETGAFEVDAERVELSWATDCLLKGRLCIEALAVQGGQIRLQQADTAEPEEPAPPAEPMAPITLPLPLEIRSLTLDDIQIALADGTRIEWQAFSTALQAEGGQLLLQPTQLMQLQIKLPPDAPPLALSEAAGDAVIKETAEGSVIKETAEGSVVSQAALEAALAVQAPVVSAPPTIPLEQRERIVLPDITLPLAVSAPHIELNGVALSGPVDYSLRHLTLALEASGQDVEIVALEVASLDADLQLSARVSLRDDYPLTANLQLALWLPELMPELAGQRLDLQLAGSLADLTAELTATGPVEAQLLAQADVLDPVLPFNAGLESPLLQWPLPRTVESAGEDAEPGEPYVVEDLKLEASGSLAAYHTTLAMEVEGPVIPLTGITLTGNGDLQHFAWVPLSLNQGGATVESRGQVSWHEDLLVEASVLLDSVDPGRFTDAMAGRLNGEIEASFAQSAAGWQLSVPQLAIDGELQELPLSLRARLAGDSNMQWEIQQFDFRQGENRMTANGTLSRSRMDVSGDMSLTQLGTLHDELSGSLRGSFRTGGSLEQPRLTLDLLGETLAFADNRLQQLELNARVEGLDDPMLSGELGIDRLSAAGQHFSRIDMTLDGRLSAHQLELEISAGRWMALSRAALRLEGGLASEQQRYAGRITQLDLDTDVGDMRLADPMAFQADLATARVQVRPFCIRREQGGALCLEETLEAGAEQGQARLAVSDLPMELLEPWLPEEWSASGETELQLQAAWRQGGQQWSLEADLDSRLDLAGVDMYGQPWSLDNTQLRANIDAGQAQVELDLELTLDDAGRIQLDLLLNDPLGAGLLDGTLAFHDVELSRYRPLAPGLEELEGVLFGRLAITGERDNPALEGDLELAGLRASGFELPLVVEDGRLRIEFAGDNGRIMGYVATEEGRLVIDGSAEWPAVDAWSIDIQLDGTQQPLLASLPQFGRLRVAPDISIAINPELLLVRGDVRVPWARLEIGDSPPSAVSPSPDEIIITRRDEMRARRQAAVEATAGDDEMAAAALREAGMVLDVRLDLHLGPDMLLDTAGLEAGLAGTLQVRQENGPVQLFGEVSLVDGRFRAYGQDLLIRQGQLLFSGPPTQPLLDFEAIRNPNVTADDVIAGLRVSGFAAEPRLALFSEPAMDEAWALSYLLRGRAPQDGDTDGALTSALIGLTLGQTGGVVGSIGQAFGVDDLALETTGVGDESQVVVSGHLTEDLRVSYGVGIFSPIAELTLRYTLWRDLYLQAVSGAAQAVDLIYSFSRPGRPPQLAD